MPASSDRLLVSSLRPWMPAENEPAEPNALMQSLQLTCSLTPSSTVPSTRLVIIWLKRWLARPPIEAPLESAPVTAGGGGGSTLQPSSHSQGPSHSSARAGCAKNKSEAAAISATETMKLRTILIMIIA